MQGVRLCDGASGKQLLSLETGSAEALAFSDDGRLLATAGREAVQLWEIASGQEVFQIWRDRRLQGSDYYSAASCLAFSPDGKSLATGHADTTILVWDLIPQSWRVTDLDAGDLDRLWAELAEKDARKAYRAAGDLAALPAKSVPFLKGRLKPAAVDADRVRRLIADLDSGRFAVRRSAETTLTELGAAVEPSVREALRGKPSLEARRRLEAVLEEAIRAGRGVVRSPEVLRHVRAIRVLEHAGTEGGREVLKVLANGAPAARETREAKAALERLAQRPPRR